MAWLCILWVGLAVKVGSFCLFERLKNGDVSG